MSKEISNRDDVIDSRDVIARIDELESERTCLTDAVDDASQDLEEAREALEEDASPDALEDVTDAVKDANEALADWDNGVEGDELKALKALQSEAEGYCDDWRYGAALIRDSYFEDYARQFADDIGAVNKDASWPNTCIDWKQAAEELQRDYTSVEFDGVTYWVR